MAQIRSHSPEGEVLEGLHVRLEGDASDSPQPTVLSCGGIYIRHRQIPIEIMKWRQIINLPGPVLSARIFGIRSPSDRYPFDQIQFKESLN